MDTADDSKILCYCKNVRYGEVRAAIAHLDAKRVDQVTAYNEAGGGCRTCHPEIQALIDVHRAQRGGSLGAFFKRLFSRS